MRSKAKSLRMIPSPNLIRINPTSWDSNNVKGNQTTTTTTTTRINRVIIVKSDSHMYWCPKSKEQGQLFQMQREGGGRTFRCNSTLEKVQGTQMQRSHDRKYVRSKSIENRTQAGHLIRPDINA